MKNEELKKILFIATGGTIASSAGLNGLEPNLSAEEILAHCPGYETCCSVDCVQPFNLDSTNIGPAHWLKMLEIIESSYDKYDGFVIAHGTDTMAYTAAALSYLIQDSSKPIVITGAQKPIGFTSNDASINLLDSLRFASDSRAHDVCLVFGGRAICGTRAKKEYSHRYNACSSINSPLLATISDERIIFYIDDKKEGQKARFYHDINSRVALMKLIPGVSGSVLNDIGNHCDAVIIESFGLGGLPDYGSQEFAKAVREFTAQGKKVIIATQVTHEGSDMSIYQVGKEVKDELKLLESFDMTLEATVVKTMWALANSGSSEEFVKLFYTPVNHDLMWSE
ncbi:MAG: asparaginase [Firmicutes bacterium]|nr:asparaginase [Bacillota bacterium]